DNNAISIFGISSGGYGVMTMAIKFPGRFATLFPIACNPHRNLHKYTIDHNTALWMLNNAGDKDIVFSRIEEEVEQIHGKNGTAYMTKFDNKGHESWRNALLETPLIDWMLWYERNPSPYKPPYNIIPPNRTEKEFFKLFILPLYANCILILLPITMLIIAKITKRTKPKITNKPLTEPEQKTQNENKTTEPKKKKSETTSRQWSNDGFRIWIDKNGNESEMRLATYSGEKAKFVLRNGKVFAAKLDHFCQEDQEILQEILFGND
ncbi:MAG: hypothetical protein LBQ66_08910, partial [Planctomycetaceae bacterium]|nr:hypothetical protein [Planctomycetaceae bacterium]